MTAARPLPGPSTRTQPFWDSARAHVLSVARCSRCAALTLPPDLTCPHCGSTDPGFEFVPVSGRGVIRSWTVVRQTFLPGFETDLPFVLVDVELDEQSELRLIGRLLDGVDAPLTLGVPVRAAFEDLSPEFSVPAFELAR